MGTSIKLTKEVTPLTSGRIMCADPEGMTLGETTASFAILDLIADKIESRKKDLRAYLLEVAAKNGEVTENGHSKIVVDGTVILRERRASKTPDVKGIETLLASKKIPNEAVFDEKVILEMNVSKVESLVALGKLPREDVEALKKVTYALKVTPSPLLEQALMPEGESRRSSK